MLIFISDPNIAFGARNQPLSPRSRDDVRAVLSNATHFLVNEYVDVTVAPKRPGDSTAAAPRVVRFFGSPVTSPIRTSVFSAFTVPDAEQAVVWDRLSRQVDVLITHGPPRGVLDKAFAFGKHSGSAALAHRLVELELAGKAPHFHVFGHMHEQRGVVQGTALLTDRAGRDVEMKSTTFINAASVNTVYKLRPGASQAIVFDVPSTTTTTTTTSPH